MSSKHNEQTAKVIEKKIRRDFPDLEIHIRHHSGDMYMFDFGENIPTQEVKEEIAKKLGSYAKEVEQEPPKPRRVRIQNDGNYGYATKLTDVDTGESIDRIYHVRVVDIDAKDYMPKAILWAYAPAMDIVANAEVVECCPCCGAQKPDLKKLDDNRIKTTINDTDLDLSIDKLKRLQDLQRATRGNNIYPAEALMAFMEWRNSRDERCPLLTEKELIDKFCCAQGWKFDQEYYDEVIRQVRANYPKGE